MRLRPLLRPLTSSALLLSFHHTHPAPLARRPPPRHSSAISMSTEGGGGGLYTYRYPRPSVTVDTVIFTADPSPTHDPTVRLLLIKRKNPPFQGKYALPGGFVDPDEDLGDAAKRELEEETGFASVMLAQVGAFGAPGRDPRGHTVTVAYTAFVLLGPAEREAAVKAGDDAAEAGWFDLARLPPLAFDHEMVVKEAWARLVVVDGGGVVEKGSGRVLAEFGGGEVGERVKRVVEGVEPRVDADD